MVKKSQEEIEKFFKQKGYVLLETYKNSTTKMLCEKDGYRIRTSYGNLYCGKTPSLWSLNNMDNIEYNFYSLAKKKNSKAIFNDYKIVTRKNRKRVILYLQCECGKSFHILLDDAIGKKYICCHECINKKKGLNRRKNNIVEDVESFGYVVLDKTKSYTTQDYIEVKDKDGYLGFVKDSGLHSGKGMSKFDVRVNKKHYIENVNIWCDLNNINVKCVDFEKTQHSRQGLKFQCNCGNYFITSISSFQNGKIKCDICTKRVSSYENIFKNYLDEQKIEYIYQYSFNQCRDVLPLPFDFYLKGYDVLVEVDGEGHFKPTHFNHINDEKAFKTFETTIRHDKIKDEFCRKNNKKLIRIPYTMFKDNTYGDFLINSLRSNEP